jgi:hypothetical protein
MSNIRIIQSEITPSDVLSHLSDMKKVYDHVNSLNDAKELHEYFVTLENDYIKKQEQNYARTVHMLHPLSYNNDKK